LPNEKRPVVALKMARSTIAPIGGSCTLGLNIRALLQPLVQFANSTTLVGGLGNFSVTAGNATSSTTSVASPSSTATSSPSQIAISDASDFHSSVGLLMFGLFLAGLVM